MTPFGEVAFNLLIYIIWDMANVNRVHQNKNTLSHTQTHIHSHHIRTHTNRNDIQLAFNPMKKSNGNKRKQKLIQKKEKI